MMAPPLLCRLACRSAGSAHSVLGPAGRPAGWSARRAASSPPVGRSASSPPVGRSASSPPVGHPASSPPVGHPASSPPVGHPASSPPVGRYILGPALSHSALDSTAPGAVCSGQPHLVSLY